LIYKTFDAYVDNHYFVACQRGCALCCTQHVTLTTIEAYPIFERLKQVGGGFDSDCFRTADMSSFRPQYTINDLANACLNHQDPPEEEPGPVLQGCSLLENGLCAVYDLRPFVCRAFLSLQSCQLNGQAEVPSGLASVIGACQQLIEHLDVGGHFGNLADILALLNTGNNVAKYAQDKPVRNDEIPMNRSLPGFLVPPEDKREVNPFLSMLFQKHVDGITFYQLMDQIRPMPIMTSP